jgi:hypothetical protein
MLIVMLGSIDNWCSWLSKYDAYWASLLGVAQSLIEEAALYGKRRQIDVKGLKTFGERKNWNGRVDISSESKKSDEMAHAKSLGSVLLKSGVLNKFGNMVFRLKISDSLKLHAELLKEDSLKSARPKAIVEPLALPIAEGQMYVKPEEIIGEDRTIDKLELVKDFMDKNHYIEILLADRTCLSDFLESDVKEKAGVYCLYNAKNKEVLDVGKSKRLKGRIGEQLIGVRDRRTGIPKFPRLFFAVLKKEKGIKEKDYNTFSDDKRRRYVEFYQNIIFESNNILRICFTRDHLRAIVLEYTLTEFFKSKNQCKYNYQI